MTMRLLQQWTRGPGTACAKGAGLPGSVRTRVYTHRGGLAVQDMMPQMVDRQPDIRQHGGTFLLGRAVATRADACMADGDPMRVLLARILNSRLETEGWDGATTPGHVATLSRYPSSSSDENEDAHNFETCTADAHPGTLCCSTTSVDRDSATKSVVIHLTTSVRLSNPRCSAVSMSDLEQLGFMSGAQQLQAAAAGLMAGNGSRTVQARHDAVLNVLQKGRVVSAEKFTNQFGHITFKCVLENPDTLQKMNALVKPTIEGHCHGWHRAQVEAVAYRLNRLLGMDYVPPCVYRPEMDVDWQHFNGGVFMYWAEGCRELRTQPMHQWGLPAPVLLSDTRILDVLIQNSDRHHGHFLVGEHWAHGTGCPSPAAAGWLGTPLPVLIDHAAGFRPEAVVDMRHDNAFNTGETVQVSARTYLRLRCLGRAVVAKALHDLLTPGEIDQLMQRRDDVLKYLDTLVAERGYEAVVLEAAQ